MPKENRKISIIIPVYNEGKNIEILYNQIKTSLKKQNFEIIFVNDASNDNSIKILRKIASKDKEVVVIDFTRNFGQTAALSAGLDYSKGEIIVVMDGDLQNDPNDIPKLLKKIDQGYSVVSGWRKNRKDSFFRVIPSRVANFLIRKITGVRVRDNGCALKVYKKEIIEEIQLYGEMHRFISIYAAWSGGRIAEVVVNHRTRKHGKSNYGHKRIFKVLLDLLVIRFLYKYISRPIHFFGKYGFWSIFFGFVTLFWAIVLKFGYGLSINRTPLPEFSVMFFVLGVQLILTGILAELLMRTYYESQGKKSYHIKKIINGKKR